MRPELLLGTLSLLFAAPGARADGPPPGTSGHAWLEGAEALDALRPWSGCPDLGDVAATGDIGDELRVRKTVDGIVANRYSAGSGRWATMDDITMRLTHGRCDAVGLRVVGGKESLIGAVTLLAFGGAARPALGDIADLAATDGAVVVSSADAPDLAAARLLVYLWRDDAGRSSGAPPGSAILGPAWPVQPEHAGRPRGSPASLWSRPPLAAAAVAGPGHRDGEPVDAVQVWRIREPSPLARRGRWQLWELRFRARLGGGLLAVYDRRTHRHRWLWASQLDEGRGAGGKVGDGHFDIVSFRGDLVLVRNRFEASETLWAIDVARGRVRPVEANGRFRLVAKGVAVEDPEGGRRVLTWKQLRP